MAIQFKGPTKQRAPKVAPISLKDELDADEPVEAPADTPFAASAEAVVTEPLSIEPTAEPASIEATWIESIEPASAEPVVAEPLIEAFTPPAPELAPQPAALAPEPTVVVTAHVAPATLDASALPLKTLDLFNENAAAVLDFALALGKARSVGDALELQSRFASERYSSLVRQAGEFAELSRRLTFQSAPFQLRVSTFVA